MERKELNDYGVMENSVMNDEDWKKRWDNRYIGFHHENVNEYLIKYETQLLSEKKRIFVPLCGKSVDLNYLADKGHDVVGCECSDIAILEFFNEHSMKFERSQHNTAPYEVFKGIDKSITIYKGDFFGLTSSLIGKFDAVWDVASFVAIHPSQRNSYISVMYDLVNSEVAYLLNIFEHQAYKFPPFSISRDDIHLTFGQHFNFSVLDTFEKKDAGFAKRKGLPYVIVSYLLLTVK